MKEFVVPLNYNIPEIILCIKFARKFNAISKKERIPLEDLLSDIPLMEDLDEKYSNEEKLTEYFTLPEWILCSRFAKKFNKISIIENKDLDEILNDIGLINELDIKYEEELK